MNYQAFIDEVVQRGQFGEVSAAKRMVEATLCALGQPLSGHLRHEIANHLPEQVAEAMRGAGGSGAGSADEFYLRISELSGLSISQALEQSQIVCAVLAERLAPTVAGRLSRELPDEIAALLIARPQALARQSESHLTHASTLAEGKPGGSRPLSESRPGSQRPVSEARPPAAQTHSVREANPHQDSKVSSAQGMTQERAHESLAEGHDPKK